jgi:hypothetical protein
MELNLLNNKINIDVNTYHEKTEKDFWKLYCYLLNVRNHVLSEKDCEILSAILTMNLNELSILEKDNGKQLEQLTNTPISNLYSKCKQLHEKGFLIKEGSAYYLHPAFKSFQNYIRSGKTKEIKFTIPVKLIENGIIST